MGYRKSDRTHVQYRNKNGIRVAGVTTVIGVMDKSRFLVPWANKLGLDGIDSRTYVDSLARAGTLLHYLVFECDLPGIPADPDYLMEFSGVDKNHADTGYIKYLDWKKGKDIKVVLTETPLVSEKHQYGGTLDALLDIDGVLTLVDGKTCKGIYGDADDKWTQLAGYDLLLEEHGYHPQALFILRLGRDDTEGFEYLPMPKRDLHRQRFLKCRELYELNKILNRKSA